MRHDTEAADDDTPTGQPDKPTADENRNAADESARSSTTPRKTPPAPEKLWTSTFLVIVAATLCCYLVGQGTNAGTSVYLSHIGGSATLAGIGAGVFSAAAAVTRVFCGPVIDRRSRAAVMAAGALIMLAGTLGPLLSSAEPLFVVWRFLQGVGFSLSTTASATAAADVLPLSRLGEGIGYYGLGQALAMSVGPALALFLVSTDPAENLYLGFSFAAVLALAFSLACRYERNPSALPPTSAYRRRWQSRRDRIGEGDRSVSRRDEDSQDVRKKRGALASLFEKRALPGMIPMIVIAPAFGFGIFFVGLYGTSIGIGDAGLFYTLSAVSMIAVRLKSKAFMDTAAPLKIMAVAVTSGLVGYGMLLSCGTLPLGDACTAVFCLAGIPYGMCLGLAMPVNQSVAVKCTPSEHWGAANALYLLATDIGIGAATVVWGVVNDAYGFTTTIWCVMACIAASLLVAKACYPKR